MAVNLAGAVPGYDVGILWPASLSEPHPAQSQGTPTGCGFCQTTKEYITMINWQYVIVIAIAYFVGARFPVLAQKIGLA